MNNDPSHKHDANAEAPPETAEERARRVAEIKRRVAQGSYRVDSREILYNMLKTAP